MKKLFVLFLVAAFLLAGCSKEIKPEIVKGTGGEMPQKTTTSTTETPAVGEDLSNEISAAEAEAEKCLTAGIKSCLPVNFKIGEIGDSLVFTYGLKNQDVNDRVFRIVVTFLEYQRAMDAAPVEAEREVMDTWVQSDYDDKLLAPQKTWAAPVIIKIGENVGEGKPTQKGTYVFSVTAQTVDDKVFTTDYESKKISVKVK